MTKWVKILVVGQTRKGEKNLGTSTASVDREAGTKRLISPILWGHLVRRIRQARWPAGILLTLIPAMIILSTPYPAISVLPLNISRVTVEESSSGYSINVIGSVQGATDLQIDGNKVSQYLQIKPEVKFQVLPHPEGFRLLGDFLPQQTYIVTIRAGLAANQAVLQEDSVHPVKIPAPTPRVEFAVKGRYLGRNLGLKLPIRLRAISELGLSIRRLPPENLVWGAGYMDYAPNQYGEPVVQDRKISLEAGEGTHLLWLDLNEFMDTSEPGVYRIVPPGEQERQFYDYEASARSRDSMSVTITDLALIAKQSLGKLWIWSVDSRTGDPRPFVRISVYSQKNVLLGTGITNAQGFSEISYEPVRQRRPTVVTAKERDDFTYLDLEAGELSLTPFSISGIPPSETNYRAYFYPERNLYRPGETLNFATLVERFIKRCTYYLSSKYLNK